MTQIWGLVAGVLLTFGTGIFVASEFALVNLDRADLEQRRARGEPRLGLTIEALKVTSTQLSSAQLGITLTTLLAGYAFEPAISSLLVTPLAAIGLPPAWNSWVGSFLAVFLATLFSMIFGELVPKNFALAVPLRTAKLVIGFQTAFTFVFKPVVLLLNGFSNRVVRALGVEPREELSGARTAEELSFLIRRSALEGTLDPRDAEMLNHTLVFPSRTVNEVMTPRVAMTSVPVEATAADVIALAVDTGHSRFPVLGDNVDDLLGIVHLKSAYALDFDDRSEVCVRDLMVEPVWIPDTIGVRPALDLLRSSGYQLAVVLDEYGGTAGIVTLEDMVEEILGEVSDEHDPQSDDIRVEANSIVFSAALRPDELWERASIEVPDDSAYETVAGFVLDRLGHIPELGEEVEVAHGRLQVERLRGVRIAELRYLPTDPDGDPALRRLRVERQEARADE